MDRVVTVHESWFISYDPEIKRQCLEWSSKGSPRPKNARMSQSKVKCMLVCFFDSMGIVYKKWVPAAQTVNQYYHTKILQRLRRSVTWFRPNIAKNWILHDDNAPAARAALSVAQFVTSQCITVNRNLLTQSRTLQLLFILKSKINSERVPL